MNDNNYAAMNALVDIIVSPARALDEVRDHPRWLWWPLLISVVLVCAAFAFYYQWVDFDWLVEQTVLTVPVGDRAAAEEGIRAFMTPTTQTVSTLAAVTVMTMLIYAIQAAYLHLVNKVATGAEIRYGQWFSFSAWTAFPGIFNALAIFAVILLADSNRVGQAELQPLSLNALFIHAEMGDPWFTWGTSLTLVNFWMLALMSMGYARWTGASLLKSTIIAVLPWVLIFGTWAALI